MKKIGYKISAEMMLEMFKRNKCGQMYMLGIQLLFTAIDTFHGDEGPKYRTQQESRWWTRTLLDTPKVQQEQELYETKP